MDAEILKELGTCRQPADRMIDRADKADVAEVARILVLQAAAYAWRFGELPIEDHADYLEATGREFEVSRLVGTPERERVLTLQRDGMVAFVASTGEVLASRADLLAQKGRKRIHWQGTCRMNDGELDG